MECPHTLMLQVTEPVHHTPTPLAAQSKLSICNHARKPLGVVVCDAEGQFPARKPNTQGTSAHFVADSAQDQYQESDNDRGAAKAANQRALRQAATQFEGPADDVLGPQMVLNTSR